MPSVPSVPVSQRIESAKATEYPTVLVCMIDELVDEGADTWSATATFLERSYKVYFTDSIILDRIRELASNLGSTDRASYLARIVAFRGICLPPCACGKSAFYAQEIAA